MDEQHSANETVRAARALDVTENRRFLKRLVPRPDPFLFEPLSVDPQLSRWLSATSARQLAVDPVAEEDGKPVIAERQSIGEELFQLL
jgi:hypothetical protein